MDFAPRYFTLGINLNKTKSMRYKDYKSIPIDYHILKINSNYFAENDKKYNRIGTITLLKEENSIELSELIFIDFVNCCQNQIIDIIH